MKSESIKYSLEALRKRKSRSLLTIISIFIGIATIFIFISFGMGLYNYVNSFVSGGSANKILIEPKGIGAPGLDSTFSLTSNDLTAVQRTAGVYSATGIYDGSAQVQFKNNLRYVIIVGYDPQNPLFIQVQDVTIVAGRELQKGEKGDAVLGYDYMIDNKIFPKGLNVNDDILINGQKVKVVGFYSEVGDTQDDTQIYVTTDFYKVLYPNVIGYNTIFAAGDTKNITNVANNIDKSLLRSRNLQKGQEDYTVQSFQDLLNSYSSALNIVIGFIILIALISVFVSAINTSNTMITSVLERIKEIGVLKSIGARNSEILGIFLFESSMLGFIAGIIGVLVGLGLTEIAGKVLIAVGLGFLQPGYSIWLFLGCILFATITGAISGVAPAIHASKISPVRALRYE